MDKTSIMEKLNKAGLIPVAVIEKAEDAIPLANAMLKGGIDVIEVTFRTAAAAESIKQISSNCPDMLVGAGTVLTLEQCKTAVEHGAGFIVCPGFDEEIVIWCIEDAGCLLFFGALFRYLDFFCRRAGYFILL